MSLLSIAVKKPFQRIKLEIELEKQTPEQKAGRPGPRVKSKITVPLERKTFVVEREVKSKNKLDDFHQWWIMWKSKYPHFEFVKKHWCSFGGSGSAVQQYILLDTRRNVKVAMTKLEMMEKLNQKSSISVLNRELTEE